MATTNSNRRTLIKGAAWAAPAVLATSTIPSYAASTQPPRLNPGAFISYNAHWESAGSRIDNTRTYKIYTYSGGRSVATPGGSSMCLLDTRQGQTVTNYTATFYLALSNLVFSAGPYGSNGWTPLTRDTSKANRTIGGITYYAYTTVYSGPVTATAGSTCLPSFSFISGTGMRTSDRFYVDNSVQVDGQLIEGSYGPISI
ncbi:hypothetical protein [Rothia nasimurium]|uniref:hypothetical protein n=1 Tax=Rothia nasimurium TaxID=85336 RepID=UPI002DD67AC4|nr:hypothetical protein [Rothia nasimurium]